MELYIHAFRTIIFYLYLALCVRLLGKREVGQLGLFDLVMILIVANVACVSIENIEIPFWYFIIVIAIIVIIQKIVSYLSLKFSKIRYFVDGKPSIMIFEGRVNYLEMKKNLYNMEDLLIQLRNEKVESILDVKIAILDHTGTLSVYTYNDTKIIPLPCIISGKIMYPYLTYLKTDEDEIIQLLEKENTNLKDVICAYYDNNKLIIIDRFYVRKVENFKK